MNPGDSLEGKYKGGFRGVIPSFPAEHQQVWAPSRKRKGFQQIARFSNNHGRAGKVFGRLPSCQQGPRLSLGDIPMSGM